MIEEMMLTRYHLEDDDEAWSREAHQFLSCSLSGSMESLVNVSILHHLMQVADINSILFLPRLCPRLSWLLEFGLL